MGWQIFEAGAERYEAWYATPKGQRADRSERKLLGRLLQTIPDTTSILEVGCGSGYLPVPISSFARRIEEVRSFACVYRCLAALPGVEQVDPPRVKSSVQLGDESKKRRGAEGRQFEARRTG